MRSLSCAIGVLLSLGTLNAFAATPKWDAITLNDQGMFYIDAHTIKDEGGRKVLWSAVDYKKPQSTADGVAYLSVQTQLQINCKAKNGSGDAHDLLQRPHAHRQASWPPRHAPRVA